MKEINTYYPSDAALLARLPTERRDAFLKWIGELDAVMSKWGAANGGTPYGDGSVARTTGLEAWYGYFDDNYAPDEAFSEDASCWD